MISRIRGASAIVLGGLVSFGLTLASAQAALATQAQPPTDWSFYVRANNTSEAYQLGYNQGSFDASNGWINSEVILDFGTQTSDGSGSCMTGVSSCYLTNGQIETYAEQFALGYWNGTGSDYSSVLTLGIGTNNSGASSTSLGTTWANVVQTVKNWLSYYGYTSQITADGANDIEPAWNSVANSNGWSNGYNNQGGSAYIDFGSADGCSSTSYANTGCSNGWVQDNVWWAAWGCPPAQAAPEIYYQVNADQWFRIAQYSHYYKSSLMGFQGPMDQYDLDSSSFTSAAAWNALWNDVNSDPNTAVNFRFSLEIHVAS